MFILHIFAGSKRFFVKISAPALKSPLARTKTCKL